jgi:hypothetical protein
MSRITTTNLWHAGLVLVLTAGSAAAQPGRGFTPPPPPPPPPPRFTPPPPPPRFTPPPPPNPNAATERHLEVVRSTVSMLRDSERMRRMTGGNTGAASPAPLRKSEVVVTAGQPLESAQQTVTLIKAHSRDAANVTLVVRRAGEEMEFAVRPGVLGLNMLTRKPGVR